jgi:hypothetical protein
MKKRFATTDHDKAAAGRPRDAQTGRRCSADWYRNEWVRDKFNIPSPAAGLGILGGIEIGTTGLEPGRRTSSGATVPAPVPLEWESSCTRRSDDTNAE